MQFIKNIQGESLLNLTGNVRYISNVTGEIQREDYIDLNCFYGFLQNLTKAEITTALVVPLSFGLTNNYNKTSITLEINY